MNLAKVYIMSVTHKPEDPLNLGKLPPVAPPDDGWAGIEAALAANKRKHRLLRVATASLAAAATLVLALVFTLGRTVSLPEATAPELVLEGTPGDQATEVTPEPLRDPPVESLIAMSRQLESRLRAYRDEVGDLPSTDLVYQVELQDLIVQVDEQLSMNPDSLDLWSQRVSLLLDVSQLYENHLRRDYYRMASL
jgi:hypothetical protein